MVVVQVKKKKFEKMQYGKNWVLVIAVNSGSKIKNNEK